MNSLKKLLEDCLDNGRPLDDLIHIVEQYDSLYENVRFLAALGTPIQSSKDFQRAYKKSLQGVYKALLAIEHSTNTGEKVPIDNPDEEAKLIAKDLAKKYAIRPVWLTEDLE